MLKILHFSDAHIDIASQGRRNPLSGLPVRVEDFLKALDTIIDAAINERVDLVIFSGDAYKDRTPVPTFQREWGRRIMRLSQASIPTILLVGNHDLSPAVGRAHTLQEFETLGVPHIQVVSQPRLLGPQDLDGLPVQVLALPWVMRSGLMASMEMSAAEPGEVYAQLEERLAYLINLWLDEKIDPLLPTILTAHASVEGATFGGERSVMLGGDLTLSGSLVRDPRLDYVALGHIHKPQNLNPNAHPPVIYPGSIERVDFGEAADDKFYIVAHIEKGKTEVEWRKLNGRRFIDFLAKIKAPEDFAHLVDVLPPPSEMANAIVRLTIEYPRQWDAMLDEGALRKQAETSFEFHLVRRPQIEARLRLPDNRPLSSLTSQDLLEIYLKTVNIDPQEAIELQKLSHEITAADELILEP